MRLSFMLLVSASIWTCIFITIIVWSLQPVTAEKLVKRVQEQGAWASEPMPTFGR